MDTRAFLCAILSLVILVSPLRAATVVIPVSVMIRGDPSLAITYKTNSYTPVRFSLPIPRGVQTNTDTSLIGCKVGTDFVPTSARITSKWHDGSIRWLHFTTYMPPVTGTGLGKMEVHLFEDAIAAGTALDKITFTPKLSESFDMIFVAEIVDFEEPLPGTVETFQFSLSVDSVTPTMPNVAQTDALLTKNHFIQFPKPSTSTHPAPPVYRMQSIVDAEAIAPDVTLLRGIFALRSGNMTAQSYLWRFQSTKNGNTIVATDGNGACDHLMCVVVRYNNDTTRGSVTYSIDSDALLLTLYDQSTAGKALVANKGFHVNFEVVYWMHVSVVPSQVVAIERLKQLGKFISPYFSNHVFASPAHHKASHVFGGYTAVFADAGFGGDTDDADDSDGVVATNEYDWAIGGPVHPIAQTVWQAILSSFTKYELMCGGDALFSWNRGLRAYGDQRLFGNTAYWGYSIQEYDPAQAIFSVAMTLTPPYSLSADGTAGAKGTIPTDNELLERANAASHMLDMGIVRATQYADHGVTLFGGVMQHRVVLWTVQDHVGNLFASLIRELFRTFSGGAPASKSHVISALQSPPFQMDASKATKTVDFIIAIQQYGDVSFDNTSIEFEWALAKHLAYDVVDKGFSSLDESTIPSTLPASCPSDIGDPTAYVGYECVLDLWILDPAIAQIIGSGHTAASLLAGYLAKYVGTTAHFQGCGPNGCGPSSGKRPEFQTKQVFPGDVMYHEPSNLDFTRPGHSLAQLLCWGYVLTGNAMLKRRAISVSTLFTERTLFDLVYGRYGFEQARIEMADHEYSHGRMQGWPLQNLLAVKQLTESDAQYAQLHSDIVDTIEGIVEFVIVEVPSDASNYSFPTSYLGMGVMLDGLVRYQLDRKSNGLVTHSVLDQWLVHAVGNASLSAVDHTEAPPTGGLWDNNVFQYRYRRDAPESSHAHGGNGLMNIGLFYALLVDPNNCLLQQRALEMMCAFELCEYDNGATKIWAQTARHLGGLFLFPEISNVLDKNVNCGSSCGQQSAPFAPISFTCQTGQTTTKQTGTETTTTTAVSSTDSTTEAMSSNTASTSNTDMPHSSTTEDDNAMLDITTDSTLNAAPVKKKRTAAKVAIGAIIILVSLLAAMGIGFCVFQKRKITKLNANSSKRMSRMSNRSSRTVGGAGTMNSV